MNYRTQTLPLYSVLALNQFESSLIHYYLADQLQIEIICGLYSSAVFGKDDVGII